MVTLTTIIKLAVSAAVIVGAAELAKRNAAAGAILVALPLSSMMALSWLYYDTRDAARTAAMSSAISWALLPSLIFLIALSLLLRRGVSFPWAMLASSTTMAAGYAVYAAILRRFGVAF